MKTALSFIKSLIIVLILCNSVNAQLITENFNYTAGNLISVTPNWKNFQQGTIEVQVIDGNLGYPNYGLSNSGRMILLNGGIGQRSTIFRNFTTQKNNGVSVYYSFLLNLINASDLDINTSIGDYFINFITSQNYFRSYIFIRQGSDPTKFCLGLAKANSDNIVWDNTDLSINTTYLIVVRYFFQNGNDMIRLWINPNLLGAEPAGDVEVSTGTDATDLSGILLSQRNKSGHEQIDGLTVTNSWSQIPLPVELIAFNANIAGNQVLLNWKTATEINNYGFEVERSEIPQAGQASNLASIAVQLWEKVGFVQGHGNSNSPKEYSFTDFPSGGISFNYRLKQIDNDGNFEYSNSLEVILDTPLKSEALQNYPNPFNPSTTISYKIQSQCRTTINIYDLLGKVVATLVNEEKQAGKYEVVWNGKDNSGKKLTSGIYFYRFTAGSFTQINKMILLN
jgi:FlgD Ig-like domain